MTVTLDDIRAAAALIEGAVVRTPSVYSDALSQALGADIVLKLENLQATGSFKTRGALVKLQSISKAEARSGVIAMSAGNHAQGVAYHAQKLGIRATIVMPRNTPFGKVEHTEKLGARVMLKGESMAEATRFAKELAEKEKLNFVHPYDDDRIIAGQGTIALEMLADDPDLDTLVVPIGGGGLISGIAVAARALKPGVRIFGVEAELYPSMHRALRGLKFADGGQTLADGIAVKTPGRRTRAIVKRLVEKVLLVGEPDLENAVQMMVAFENLVAEGAGAAPLAALVRHRKQIPGRRVGLVVSGGNIDRRLLATILPSRPRPRRKDGAPQGRDTGYAGDPRQGGAADRRERRQYHRDLPPPAVLRRAGQDGRVGRRGRNPQRRPRERNRHPPHGRRISHAALEQHGARQCRLRGLFGIATYRLNHSRRTKAFGGCAGCCVARGSPLGRWRFR